MNKYNEAYKTIGEVVKILKLEANKKGVLPTHLNKLNQKFLTLKHVTTMKIILIF